MAQVMALSGKAKEVFKYLELVSKYKGKVTLKELSEKQAKSSKSK